MKRRDFIKTPLTTGALLAASQLPTLGTAVYAANQPQPAGTTDWQLTNIQG